MRAEETVPPREDDAVGVFPSSEGADTRGEDELCSAPPRYRCLVTEQLGILAGYWLSIHKTYQAGANRIEHIRYADLRAFMAARNEAMKEERDKIGVLMARTLKKHPIYPWLASHKGAPKGAHTARMIAIIGDPLRFPGRKCAEGHHLPEDYDGDACPCMVWPKDRDKKPYVCSADMGPVRRGTGRRSLRHYLGMHVDNGKFPRMRKGHQCDWNPEGRGAILQPMGISEQLIRQRVEPWRTENYDNVKERLKRERGVDRTGESDSPPGPTLSDNGGGGADTRAENVVSAGPAVVPASGSDPSRGGGVDRSVDSDDPAGPAAVRGDGSEDRYGGGVEISSDSDQIIGPAATDLGCAEAPAGSDGAGGAPDNGKEGADPPHDSDRGRGPLRPYQIDSIARKRIGSRFVEDMAMEWKRIALEEGGQQ